MRPGRHNEWVASAMNKGKENENVGGGSPGKNRAAQANVKVKTPAVECDADGLDNRPVSDTIRRMALAAREADDRGETEPFPE
jgi:hypothetical protein